MQLRPKALIARHAINAAQRIGGGTGIAAIEPRGVNRAGTLTGARAIAAAIAAGGGVAGTAIRNDAPQPLGLTAARTNRVANLTGLVGTLAVERQFGSDSLLASRISSIRYLF